MANEQSHSGFKIQVAGTPGGTQVSPESASEDFIDGTAAKLEAVASVIEASTEPFLRKLSELKLRPSECTIEFGVNVGGEAGVPFITKGTVGANFKVSMKWNWTEGNA